jgi:hypothetical protein
MTRITVRYFWIVNRPPDGIYCLKNTRKLLIQAGFLQIPLFGLTSKNMAVGIGYKCAPCPLCPPQTPYKLPAERTKLHEADKPTTGHERNQIQ